MQKLDQQNKDKKYLTNVSHVHIFALSTVVGIFIPKRPNLLYYNESNTMSQQLLSDMQQEISNVWATGFQLFEKGELISETAQTACNNHETDRGSIFPTVYASDPSSGSVSAPYHHVLKNSL